MFPNASILLLYVLCFSFTRYYPTAAHGKGGREDGFVPAEEYDELSKLCDKLLTQQEQLQEEVRKQKQMLQVRAREL
jgi:hypothetical protein